MNNKKSLYEILGTDPSATAEEIKSAYRDKAKEAHPDKKGDTAAMAEINNAYAVLSNSKRRAKYDKTGNDASEPSFHKKFSNLFDGLLMQIIANPDADIKKNNVIGLIKESVSDGLENANKCKVEFQELKKRLNIAKGRIKSPATDNIVLLSIEVRIAEFDRQIESANEEIDFMQKSLSVLEKYKYEVDPEEQPRSPFFQVFFDDILSSATDNNSKRKYKKVE